MNTIEFYKRLNVGLSLLLICSKHLVMNFKVEFIIEHNLWLDCCGVSSFLLGETSI